MSSIPSVDPASVGSGTGDRLWVDGRVQPPLRADRYEVTERPQRIPMRDGVGLAAVVFEPVHPAGPQAAPCVVVTNGYAANDYSMTPYLRDLASWGYPVVHAHLRGVAPSEGTGGLYEGYGPDGHDVIEWAAAQSFCNGRIGMVGASLLGISQWLAAKEHPEHLRVLVPDDSPNNTYEYLWYQGGLPPGPGRRRRQEVPGVQSEYAVAAREPWFNDFWRSHAATHEDIQELARRGLPALTSSGWDSYMVEAASRAFTWMREAGAGTRVKLVIGPWRHGRLFARESTGYDEAPGETIRPYTGFEIQLRWLDRWLRDDDNGVDTEPPVQIYVQGPDCWRYEHDWPIPDERRVRLFLAELASGTVSSRNDGSLQRELPPQDATASYDFNPATSRNPAAVSMPAMLAVAENEPPKLVPAVLPPGASRVHGRLIIDKTPYEREAATWTSAVLERPAEITGYVRAVLWASVSRPDAAFVAELTDVAPPSGAAPGPEGAAPLPWSSTQITRGYLRADAQFSRTGPTALRPGDVYRFEIELHPTSYVVQAGHRIRLTVQGAPIDPDLDVLWQGPGLGENPFSVTIRSGPRYASHLDVPFIGDDPSV